MTGWLLEEKSFVTVITNHTEDFMKKLTHEEFVSRIDELYDSKYKVLGVYTNNSTKLDILCPDHGVWKSSPLHFLKGHRCKKCAGNHKYTTEEFIEKVKLVHGDAFDFSLVQYETSHKKIKVICPKHGVFETQPYSLLNGCGGGKCNGKNKTTEEFVQELKNINGDRYDYSKVVYKNTKTKITVICKEHGEFKCNIGDHLNGAQCPKCHCTWKRNTDDIIKEFREVHGDAFDYSLVDYKDANTHVEIICNTCGYKSFQKPSKHLRMPKGNCQKCKRNPRILTDKEIIDDLCIIHNNKYLYPNFKFTKTVDNVLVMCPEHGEFEIPYGSHKSGAGCQKCANVYSYTTEEFVSKYAHVHDFKYDYSQFVYKDSRTKSTIICPKHGAWQQKPCDHIQGYGCPRCRSSKGELAIRRFLIKNSIKFEQQYKIPECKNINPLPFDFAIFNDDGSLFCLCEFHGEQHYRPVRFHKMSDEKMIKKFNDTVFRDTIKKEYCEKNQIKILYISYKQLDEIEEILFEYLKLNSH